MKRKALLAGIGAAGVTGLIGARAFADSDRASIVVRGGTIYTGRADGAVAEALAINGDRILAVGSRATIDGYIGLGTRVVNLNGGMLLPGFIDTHTHFVWGSLDTTRVDLSDAMTPADIEHRLRAYVKSHPHDVWILGGNWQYDAFAQSGGLPTKAFLDRVMPDRPVALDSFDGHSMWLNSRALAIAGITRNTPDPRQNGRVMGTIVRDPHTGEPTGVLKEGAVELAVAVIPKPPKERLLSLLRDGMHAANARGVTTVYNATGDLYEMDLYQTLFERRELTLRTTTAYANLDSGVRHTLSEKELAAFEEARRRYTGDWVSAGPFKFFMDGVIETHTAGMLAPYANKPGFKGNKYYPQTEFTRMVIELDKRGYAIMTHAIGDSSVRETLDAYAAAETVNGPRDRRWRIEHIETCSPADVPRFAKLGVIASMQPYHFCCHDAKGDDPWSRNIGRARWTEGFQWRSITDAGAVMIHGSDWPVVTIDPFIGLYSGLTREDPQGRPAGGWFPKQRLHLDELLAGYTRNAAYAGFKEDRIGTLEVGKRADFVAIDRDLRRVSPQDVLHSEIRLTAVGGRVVYEGHQPPNRAAELPSRPADACACHKFARAVT